MKKALIFALIAFLSCKSPHNGYDISKMEIVGMQEMVDLRKTLPRCEGVGQSKLGARLPFIAIGIQKTGKDYSLIVNRRKTDFKNLEKHLYYEIEQIISNGKNSMLESTVIVILADKTLEYQYIEKLLQELRRLHLFKVQLNCNEGTVALYLKGIPMKLPPIDAKNGEKNYNLMSKVREEITPPNKEETVPLDGSPPPPPPPPPLPYAEHFEELGVGNTHNRVRITKSGIIYNNKNTPLSELDAEIRKSFETGIHKFLIITDKDATYQTYYQTYALIREGYLQTRNTLSLKEFDSEYSDLSYKNKKTIQRHIPFIIIHNNLY